MRVVLDTNILISACWSPEGLEDRVVQLGLERRFTMAVSTALLDEYREVLARPKFLKIAERIRAMQAKLEPLLIQVAPNVTLHLATDDDDNRVLECAQAAGADYIVTGNLAHFPLAWPVARIVNARQFLTGNGWL